MTSREPVGRLPEHFAKSSGRRKLSAIVYADVVGYSRLIELDDVGTVARLRDLRTSLIDTAVHKHGGNIVQTGGDSLLILFDSIDGAVQCALNVQRLVPVHDVAPPDRCIRFRIGINIGDIIAEGTDFTVMASMSRHACKLNVLPGQSASRGAYGIMCGGFISTLQNSVCLI